MCSCVCKSLIHVVTCNNENSCRACLEPTHRSQLSLPLSDSCRWLYPPQKLISVFVCENAGDERSSIPARCVPHSSEGGVSLCCMFEMAIRSLGNGMNPQPPRTMFTSCRYSSMSQWRHCNFLHSVRYIPSSPKNVKISIVNEVEGLFKFVFPQEVGISNTRRCAHSPCS